MELNREQITKSLVCLSGEEIMFCRECRYNGVGAFSCRKELAKDALALIKELTGENERLKADTVHKMYEKIDAYFVEHNDIKYGGGLIHKVLNRVINEMLEENNV